MGERDSSRMYAFLRMIGDSDPVLNLVVRHVYPRQPWWLAIERFVFQVAGREYTVSTERTGVRSNRIIGQAAMTEWYCVLDADMGLLRALSEADAAALRCESIAGVHERNLSPQEITALSDVVWSWQVLGGQW